MSILISIPLVIGWYFDSDFKVNQLAERLMTKNSGRESRFQI